MGDMRENYALEWRQNVSKELEESARLHQSAAVINERVNGRLDDHDRRIRHLEGAPDGIRSGLGTYGGCVSQVIFAVLSASGVLISLVSLAIVVFRR